jgi:hypothetical protein
MLRGLKLRAVGAISAGEDTRGAHSHDT